MPTYMTDEEDVAADKYDEPVQIKNNWRPEELTSKQIARSKYFVQFSLTIPWFIFSPDGW